MTLPASSYQRPILLRAVRDLIYAARSERALLTQSSPQRRFFLGVEAAAQEVLHPELGSARAPAWLDREAPAFREGYLRTAALLAAAKTAAEPPMRIPLPEPPRPDTHSEPGGSHAS